MHNPDRELFPFLGNSGVINDQVRVIAAHERVRFRGEYVLDGTRLPL